MNQHAMTIEIRKDGEVKVIIEGARGREVHDYIEFFRKSVGKVKSQEIPHETYEPPPPIKLDLGAEERVRNIEW